MNNYYDDNNDDYVSDNCDYNGERDDHLMAMHLWLCL